jgi:Dolichyl-phosphate-mannose-protein mannosyltransferase
MSTAESQRLPRHGAALLTLAVIALLIRLGAGFAQHAMVPEYAAYYTTVAEQLAGGHGLTVPYAWSYLTPAVANGLALPRPAFDVWLPAASLVATPFVSLFGGDAASRVAGALAGAALVPLVALLGRRTALATGRSNRDADVFALVAAGLVAISLPFVTGSISSDSQALFGVTTVAGVLAVERALGTGRRRDLALAGLVLGAGLWTRNETIFLVASALVVAAAAGALPRSVRLGRAALLAATTAACYAPWAVRQWLVFGTPMPSQTAANAFSVSPLDIFAWSSPPPSLATYLAVGPATLLDQRVTAFSHNLLDVAIIPALPWSVVGLVGVAMLWRARPLRLLTATAVAVFVADTLVFPVSTLFGTFLHGSVPALALLAIGAAEVAVRVAGAASRYAVAQSLAAVVAVVTVVGLLVATSFETAGYAAWANAVPVRYEALANGLAAADLVDAVVIASHPSWTWRISGYPSVALPDEDAASVLSLAKAYGATVVAVDGVDGPWPDAASATACLVPIDLPADAGSLTAFRVVCTGP